jgi:hypothetical protein
MVEASVTRLSQPQRPVSRPPGKIRQAEVASVLRVVL